MQCFAEDKGSGVKSGDLAGSHQEVSLGTLSKSRFGKPKFIDRNDQKRDNYLLKKNANMSKNKDISYG